MKIHFKQKQFKIVEGKISKAKAIDISGNLLLKNNFIKRGFISKMHIREAKATVAIGNGLAIPHGTDDASILVRKPGLSLTIFPKGIKWGSKKVYCAIGIASKNNDHIQMLSVIATIFSSKNTAKEMAQIKNINKINDFINNKYKGMSLE